MSSYTNSPGSSDPRAGQKSRPLPGSNQSPCAVQPTADDRITGIPDNVLRPVRKEVDVNSITPNFVARDKGYNVVNPV